MALIDDISFPTIQAGLEFRLSDRISWYNEFGIKYRKSFYENKDTSFTASKGFKAKTEIRYYFQRRKRTPLTGFYFAANGFFTQDFYNSSFRYLQPAGSSTEYEDVFAVKKNIFGINLVCGYQKNISKRFSMEFYTGLGVRFRDVHTTHLEYDSHKDTRIESVDLNINGIRDDLDVGGGFTTAPNFTLGLRFCYRL